MTLLSGILTNRILQTVIRFGTYFCHLAYHVITVSYRNLNSSGQAEETRRQAGQDVPGKFSGKVCAA